MQRVVSSHIMPLRSSGFDDGEIQHWRIGLRLIDMVGFLYAATNLVGDFAVYFP